MSFFTSCGQRPAMLDTPPPPTVTRRAILPAAIWLASTAAALAAAPGLPIQLHPENPHYFLWRGEPTILITSGEHYGALLNLDFDYARYLAELENQGLNHTRTFSGVYREAPASFGITDNPLAPKPLRYLCPWARSGQPGYADGGNKFDLTRFDPDYFQRLKQFMQEAQRRGVVVELNLFCPMYRDDMWNLCPMHAVNNVNGVGQCAREDVYNLSQPDLTEVQLAVTRRIVKELQEFGNLYYEVCNEPYFGGVTIEWQHRIVDAIVDAQQAAPHQHLISMNIANGAALAEHPHPHVSILNFHYCTPPDAVAMNYHLNRAIGENETGFRGKDDVLYRTEGWDFLLAGGALYNNLDYSFTPAHPSGTFADYQSPGGGSAELRRQLRVLKDFLYGFDFIRMKPDRETVRAVSPDLSARALSEPGKAYAIYLHKHLPKKPKDLPAIVQETITAQLTLVLPAGVYDVQWREPATGLAVRAAVLKHEGGEWTAASPPFAADVALKINAR